MNARRKFLKKAGLLLGSAPLLLHAIGRTQNGPKKLGVCLVGLGSYSTENLAPALQLTQHCQLTSIVTGSPQKIPAWQQKYGVPDRSVYSYERFDEIANNPDIDVVYIVLPTGLHAKYAIKAANAGKHVWCEKPMAMTSPECQAIIDACARNQVKLTIGYRMQHEPNTRRFMAWAKEQPYGKIKEIKAEIGYAMVPPRDIWRMSKTLGGGFLYDLGVYSINALRYAAQEEPVAVQAVHITKRPQIFSEVSETTAFTFEFPSGVVGHGRHSAGETLNLLRVGCERGWYQLAPFQTYDGILGETSDGLRFKDEIKNQQARQMDADALAILNHTEVLVGGAEGMRDIRLLEAINLSAARGERISL